MTPQIFIGLGNKTPLHEKFYELIGKYGGRDKLIDSIEGELIKSTKYKIRKRKKPERPYMWNDEEIVILKNNIRKRSDYLLRLLPNRSIYAINKQRQRLYRKQKHQ